MLKFLWWKLVGVFRWLFSVSSVCCSVEVWVSFCGVNLIVWVVNGVYNVSDISRDRLCNVMMFFNIWEVLDYSVVGIGNGSVGCWLVFVIFGGV